MLSKIKASRVVFPDAKKFKIHVSEDGKDFICRLLEKRKEKRLGTQNDLEELLGHPWLYGIDTNDIVEKNIVPPFVPNLENELDTKYFDKPTAKDMTETYIPREKQQEITHAKKDFAGFEAGFDTLKK